MGCIDIDSITVGERDRDEMGDIDGLAESIDEVGLLHPVVVTAAHVLVAGGRRLEACRRLGWLEVPITVVDLGSAATTLRAELDENTCRKPLTPYEASKARERRAAVLAPMAAESKVEAGREYGRGHPKASSNLDEAFHRPTARAVRKTAASGTGYSGSTIDKVDRIRDAAERGVVKRGRTEVPVPEPVRKVAREALEDVKQTGAAVDNASQRLARALDKYVDDDPAVQNAHYCQAFWRALKATDALRRFDLTKAATAFSAEDWDDADILIDSMERWIVGYRAARPRRLRVMDGGKR